MARLATHKAHPHGLNFAGAPSTCAYIWLNTDLAQRRPRARYEATAASTAARNSIRRPGAVFVANTSPRQRRDNDAEDHARSLADRQCGDGAHLDLVIGPTHDDLTFFYGL